MADRKISDLTALTTPASGDYLPIVDISEAAAASKNKRITIEELMRGAPNGTAAAPSIAFESDPNTGIYSPGADQLAVSTGGTGRLFVDSSGRVGIGTSSPGSLLNLAHPIVSDIRLTVAGTLVGNIYGSSSDLNVHAVANVPLTFATNNTERARITSAGNVGIGTTSPAVLLDCQGTGSQTIRARTNDTSGAAQARLRAEYLGGGGGVNTNVELRAGDQFSYLVNTTNHPLLFGINSTERARIDSSGRLLVGTSSVKTSADVKQEIVNGGLSVSRYANDAFANQIGFAKSRGASNGTIVQNGDQLGPIIWNADDGTATTKQAAIIDCYVDGTPGADDMPGRMVFSTTADGAAIPTERLRITSAGVLQIADAGNIAVGTTTGTKIGTGTTQKIGFYNATPVVQPTAVADATDAATVITQLNALLTRMRNLGLIAT
jgi:hypothetical protein